MAAMAHPGSAWLTWRCCGAPGRAHHLWPWESRDSYVLVEPSREDVYSYDYSARLAEAEIDLRDKENLKILLVPVFPG